MRSGFFSRSQVLYGPSMSVVKPPDNDPGSYLSPELLDPLLALTEAQMYDLQSRIDDLYAMLRGERQFFAR